ncbi:hypothetical protein B0O80DRAFT_512714 [Mortierella sp. GBAus27b]|nr:hypothetical protein B0O80DRAFT_512714 [Mortierella sp. GBAus27b]
MLLGTVGVHVSSKFQSSRVIGERGTSNINYTALARVWTSSPLSIPPTVKTFGHSKSSTLLGTASVHLQSKFPNSSAINTVGVHVSPKFQSSSAIGTVRMHLQSKFQSSSAINTVGVHVSSKFQSSRVIDERGTSNINYTGLVRVWTSSPLSVSRQ